MNGFVKIVGYRMPSIVNVAMLLKNIAMNQDNLIKILTEPLRRCLGDKFIEIKFDDKSLVLIFDHSWHEKTPPLLRQLFKKCDSSNSTQNTLELSFNI